MSRIEELEKRLAADPSSRIFVQLAEEYRKQGLLENAIEICEQGLTKHPQYPSARVALGRALLQAESYDRASAEFEAVLAQIPDNILANKFLGETYHRLGRYEEAIEKYQIAQTLSPDDNELEGKIEAVNAEMAAGGPPPPSAEPADRGVAAAQSQQAQQAQQAQQESASWPAPLATTPKGAAPVTEAPEPLEATLVDATGVGSQANLAPPPLPPPLSDEDPTLLSSEPQEEEADPLEEEPLAPIPLVDVDEPMILEGSSYSTFTTEPEPPPLERVPIVSSMDFYEMAPPPPAESPTLPPLPPLPSQQPDPTLAASLLEVTPPMESPASEPPPLMEAAPHAPAPLDPTPIEPDLVELGAATADAHSSAAMETPTMAELYAAQGYFDKAVLVYRNLLVRDPNETKYLERIEELEMLANASAESATATPRGRVEPRGDTQSDAGTRETIEVLEQWLDVIRRTRRA